MTTAKAVVIRLIIVIYYRLYDYFFVGAAVANAANCSTAPLLAITFAPWPTGVSKGTPVACSRAEILTL